MLQDIFIQLVQLINVLKLQMWLIIIVYWRILAIPIVYYAKKDINCLIMLVYQQNKYIMVIMFKIVLEIMIQEIVSFALMIPI